MPEVLVKTVVMMSGELEYEDIFYNGTSDHAIQYPLTAYVMFLIFTLLVTVILTNLLVGLAVSDIQVNYLTALYLRDIPNYFFHLFVVINFLLCAATKCY